MNLLQLQVSTYRRVFETGRAIYVSLTLLGRTVWIQRWARNGGQPKGRTCPFNADFTWKGGSR
jgi:hypothetical protein